MNTYMNALKNTTNFTHTENGMLTHKTTESAVLDMFGQAAAYRNRSDEDCILLFKNAFEEDPILALKCLFYLRDVRGGQGERRYFRTVYRWLCKNEPRIATTNLEKIPEFGRWDDLIYITESTDLETPAFYLIKYQLQIDKQSKTPSLLAKWMPSQNASNAETKRLGHKLANFLEMTDREYRKTLSALREKIKVLETLMSENRWDEIEFDKIPSRAGLIYKNAFAHKEVTAARYAAFIKDKNTKVNASVLYPYDIAHRIFSDRYRLSSRSYDDPERIVFNKYWDNLPDIYQGREENAIAIVDTSGSMSGQPMEVAISLGAYVADKAKGPFANHFITFSANPQLQEFTGVDIVDKFIRCQDTDWGQNTNIEAVFNLLLKTAINNNVAAKDMPQRLYIFSDMQFDQCVCFNEDDASSSRWMWHRIYTSESKIQTGLEKIATKWKQHGYELPQVVFWNLSAGANNCIPALGERFSYVSGFSPNILKQILTGKTNYDLMLEVLCSDRYKNIKI